jgi:hypothetical protein
MLRSMTKRISSFLIYLFLALPVQAAPLDSAAVSIDTMAVRGRHFDQKKINEFKANSDFRYGRPQEGLSWWERFLFGVIGFIIGALNFFTNTLIGQIVFYGACALLIIYVVMKILRVDVKDLFYRTNSGKTKFHLEEADLHEMDFEKLIEEAIHRKQFRNAVRLIFLHALKKLAGKGLIQWVPGKTNEEYLYELRNHPAGERLRILRYYFDYAWYGHFEVTEQTIAIIQTTFGEFNESIS